MFLQGVYTSTETCSISDTSDTSIDPNLNSQRSEYYVENKADRLDSVVVDEMENAEEETKIEVIRLKGSSKHGHGKRRKSKKHLRQISNNSPILNEPLNEKEEESMETLEVKLKENPVTEMKLQQIEKDPDYVEEDRLKDILSSIPSKTDHSEESSEVAINNGENDTQGNRNECSLQNDINSKTAEVDVYKSQSKTEYDFSEVDEENEVLNGEDKKSIPEKEPYLDLGESDNVNGDVQYSNSVTEHHDRDVCDIKQTGDLMPCEKSNERLQIDVESNDKALDETDGCSVDKSSEGTNSASVDDLSIYSSSFSTSEKPSSASQMQDMVDHIISQSDAVLQAHMFEEETEEMVSEKDEEGKQLYPGEVV